MRISICTWMRQKKKKSLKIPRIHVLLNAFEPACVSRQLGFYEEHQ